MSAKLNIYNTREEWLAARTSYIGGSDAAAILGLNPWKSNVDLWEIKTGRKPNDDTGNEEAVKYGHDAEPLLRELFTLDHPEYNVEYIDNNMWTNEEHPAFHASLDGWLTEKDTGRKGIWECKTATVNNFNQLKDKWGDFRDPKIPDNYFCQVLTYLLVTEFDFVELTAQIKFAYSQNKETRQYHIERSEVEDDIAYLDTKGTEFAEYIKKDIRPALLLPDI